MGQIRFTEVLATVLDAAPRSGELIEQRLEDLAAGNRAVYDRRGSGCRIYIEVLADVATDGIEMTVERDDQLLYDRLLNEFPAWLTDARAAGVIP